MKKIITLLLATNLSAAQVLLQASYGTQLSPSIIRMAGYYVQFDQQMTSPYDVGLGYMFNFKNMFVLPVMLEGKPLSLESWINSENGDESVMDPFEILLRPGIRLDDHEVYGLVGFQLRGFKQTISEKDHNFSLQVRPNFYGAGYSRSLSEYFDYITEFKFYYQSAKAYAMGEETLSIDDGLKVTDASCRVGLRLRI